MPETWTKLRASALDSVETLKDLLADQNCDDHRLVAGYLEAKQLLAQAFEAFSVERYVNSAALDNAKAAIEHRIDTAYPHLPAKYRRVRGFGESHYRLLAYLIDRVGTEVSAAELRMLTGDAVHTERRARELRDLGFRLDARHASGSDVYVLQSSEPDGALGARTIAIRNIREDRSTSKEEASQLLRSLDGD